MIPLVFSAGVMVLLPSSVIAVTFVLRFLVVAVGLATLSYFATPFSASQSAFTGAALAATRAERLKDMLFLAKRVA